MSNNEELRRRLKKLQERLEAENASLPQGTFRTVICEGFLPPGIPLFAMTSGGVEFIRMDDEDGSNLEDLDVFVDRCKAGAREAGETHILKIGGLPSSDAQRAISKRHENLYWASDDSVPPCEPPGSTRRW